MPSDKRISIVFKVGSNHPPFDGPLEDLPAYIDFLKKHHPDAIEEQPVCPCCGR